LSRNKARDVEREKAFIEDMARRLESHGTPWIAGAIVGYLCVTPESEASQARLAEELGSSVAAISAMVRRLCREGTLERVVVPGQRAAHYRLTPGSYVTRLHAAVKDAAELVELADRGLGLPGLDVTAGRAYLREFRELNMALHDKIADVIDEHADRARRLRRG
jgi:DNA-binding MarR family transcriptional regulator